MRDDNSTDKKKPAPRLRRIGDIGINLFAPLAETRWMLAQLPPYAGPASKNAPEAPHARPATGESSLYDLGRSRQGQWPYGSNELDRRSATPQDVLADRILADDDTGTLMLVRHGPCCHSASGHHPDTYNWPACTDECHCTSTVLPQKTLIVSYRLWQLNERRVSEDEQGTFPRLPAGPARLETGHMAGH